MPIRSWQTVRLSSCSCGFIGGLAGRGGLPREVPKLPPPWQATVGLEEGSCNHVQVLLGWLVPREKQWYCLLPPVSMLGALNGDDKP